MNKLTKVIITVAAIFVALLLFGLATAAAAENGGHTPGIIGLIIFGGVVGGLKALWKGDKKDGSNNEDNSILQK